MPVRFQVDPDFYDHPKTAGMSDAAFSLWVRAGSFSAAKLTDGFIAETVLVHTLQSDTPVADELVERGLWRRRRGGYVFHEWNQRNLTRQRVRDNQNADAKRKREERKKSPDKSASNGAQPKSVSTNDQVTGQDVRPDTDRTPVGHAPESDSCCVGVGVVSSSSGYVGEKSTDRARSDQRVSAPILQNGPTPSGPAETDTAEVGATNPQEGGGCQPPEVRAEVGATNPLNRKGTKEPVGPVGSPVTTARGDRAVAEALNATSHSAEARGIIRKWSVDHNEPLPQTIYTQLARQIDTLRDRGATGAYVWAALLAWDEKRAEGEKPRPGLLPYLHDQIKLDGLAPYQLYATPVEYLRDEDIDVFEVLGYDSHPPEAPDDIENGPFDIRHDWYAKAIKQRHHERCIQAREVITRRQAMRQTVRESA